MKKINLLVASFVFSLCIFIGTSNVYAKEKPFYTNLNGVELTETQYNNLIKALDEDTIATLTQDMADILKDDTKLVSNKYSKYIKIDNIVDKYGNILFTTETEVTKEEAMNFVNNPPAYTKGYPVHQTTMKRLTINITVGSISVKTITLTNEWLSMPVTRSHDVIAIRPNTSFTINNGSNISGYLKKDGTIVQSYSQGHSNIRSISGGVGLSMPLPSGGSSMSNGLTIIVIAGADPFTAYGSYQHAQSSVTLAQSKVYNINSNGLGGVIDFTNATTRAKYDAMQGVYCTWSTSTLSCV